MLEDKDGGQVGRAMLGSGEPCILTVFRKTSLDWGCSLEGGKEDRRLRQNTFPEGPFETRKVSSPVLHPKDNGVGKKIFHLLGSVPSGENQGKRIIIWVGDFRRLTGVENLCWNSVSQERPYILRRWHQQEAWGRWTCDDLWVHVEWSKGLQKMKRRHCEELEVPQPAGRSHLLGKHEWIP